MRLVRYRGDRRNGVGVLLSDEGPVVATPWASFEELFAQPDPSSLAVADFDVASAPRVTAPRLLAPTVDRATIIGTGGNYADHAAESRRAGVDVREPVFVPFLWSAVIGPDPAKQHGAPRATAKENPGLCPSRKSRRTQHATADVSVTRTAEAAG